MAAENNFRVVLVGVGGVGKSCLTIQFIADRFVEEYDPTLEDSYRKQVTVDGEECLLDIFDTAGEEDFSAVRDQYMRTGDGFLCVYSVTLESSLEEAMNFYDHILRVKDVDTIPFILLGNKADLVDERKISQEDGEKAAEELGCKFMETSAKTKQNVNESFHEIVRQIREWKSVNETSRAEPKKKAAKQKKEKCVLQ